MSRFFLVGGFVAALLLILSSLLLSTGSASRALDAEGVTLRRFASADEFNEYLQSLTRRQEEALKMFDVEASAPRLPSIEFSPAPGSPAEAPVLDQAANPEITNNQTIGVDEGGIVKQIGRFLVVLQDGRLFSADLGTAAGAPLRLADRIDVYRGVANAADWYDEMLVQGNRILVTAYDYRQLATEITVVRIDETGRLNREGRFLLSASDYYSTENYATRLVGDQLVLYAPQTLNHAGPTMSWPRLRRADGDGEPNAGEALIDPTDVYAPPGEIEWPVLHTVSVCPLRESIQCRTTAFLGPPIREFYVSPTDAFLWMGAESGPWGIDYANLRRQSCPSGEIMGDGRDGDALVYRIPLGGDDIGAIIAQGIPADQFAFDSRNGRFRALLTRRPLGCYKPDRPASLSLLDLPLSAFRASIGRAANAAYASLPPIPAGQLENRFLGDWLVYGGRTSWSGMEAGGVTRPGNAALFAVPVDRPREAVRLDLPHNALRIERAGSDAVVTGYGDSSGLRLSYVSLEGNRPRVAGSTRLDRRFESEGRSHAFNAWVRPDGSGLIGLPTTYSESRSGRGWSDSQSSDLSFIAIAPNKALVPAGELATRPQDPRPGYRCEVSCVDWYGNSRPIFTGGRIFALMGTDLVEGRMEGRRIGEAARLDLTGEPTRLTAR